MYLFLLALNALRGTCIKGYFGPLLSQRLKIAFRQFLSIGLLEEKKEV